MTFKRLLGYKIPPKNQLYNESMTFILKLRLRSRDPIHLPAIIWRRVILLFDRVFAVIMAVIILANIFSQYKKIVFIVVWLNLVITKLKL